MKKIGILTHYNVNNQGAQLQMYALYNRLKELKQDPIVLTYNKNFDFTSEDIKKRNIITLKSIPYIIKEFLLKKGVKLTYFNYKKYITNNKFSKENFEFKNYTKDRVDCAIVGSDEVFSIECGVNIMMYGHCVNTNKMISYAPSFGQTGIDLIKDKRCLSLISSGLKSFDNISVRDQNTKNIVKELTGIEAKIVCDPVLLYDFNKISVEIKPIKEKYIIVYAYDKNMMDEDEINAIKKYARTKGLKTASIGTYHKWCDYNINCDCLQWIEYFRRAECVITDTFHGTIVSVITERPMAVFIRENLNKNKLSYLTEQLKIEDRVIKSIEYENIDNVISKDINYNNINRELSELRKYSDSYLQEAIGDINEN